ncbi:phasin family protein [Paenibacillus rigui]|uniref:Polyhydroxyalkanoate synthesis regulator n=1 Tax=Paenibacillus rigui TaxID=554312 RepID=A0A229UVQ0_9BACL|nr:hypothetical protein [Paenibacillus rigui]OXM87484.1 hypothetical protein CF651_05130 [Paenibacillus rigui]
MRDFLDKAVSLGLGFAVASKEQAEKFVDELIKKGELNKAESQQFVDELVKKGQEAQSALEVKVREYLHKAVHEMNLTTKEDYVRLKNRVAELELRVAQLEGSPAAQDSLPPGES